MLGSPHGELSEAVVWITDADLRIVWSSGAGVSLWGLPDQTGRTLMEALGTADPEHPAIAAARRALRGEKCEYDQELGGRSFNVLIEPLRDSSGKIAGTTGVALETSSRKQAAEAALRSEARLAGIINISEDAIISFDAEQKITLFNPGAEKIFGYAAGEVMGRTIDVLLPPRFVELHRRHMQHFSTSPDALRAMNERGTIYGRRKDGTEFPAEASISKFEVAGEVVLNIRLRDITDRKLAEEQLQARARQQSAVAEIGLRALRGGDRDELMREICELVARTLMVEFVKVLEVIPGGDLRLLAGVGWREGVVGHRVLPGGPGSLAAYTLASSEPVFVRDLLTEKRFVESFLAEHGVVSGMNVIIHGQERPFGILGAHSTSPRSFTRDDINFLQAVANVLAAALGRMHAEEELRTSNETLQVVNESMPVAISFLDLEGCVRFWNPAAERLFGWKEDEVLGHPIPVIPEDQAEQFRQQLEAFRRGERLTGLEARRRKKDGSIVDVGLWSAPLHDASGAVRASLVIGVDLTERKRIEEQLRETQKLESIGALAGGVAHDFNNLLTGILGNISLALEQTPSQDPIRELLRGSLHASERAAELVRQLLAYAGKGRFVIEPIDISAVVRDVAPLLRTSVPRQVRFELQLADQLPPVRGDHAQMQQIVMNLAANAGEAIGDRPGTVLIRTGTRDVGDETEGLAPGPYVSLEVHDDGAGIDEATLAQIFDPFFTTKFTGRGLGLAAVSGIVRAHHGAIRVTSERGKGATFEVLLPASGGRPSNRDGRVMAL